MKRRILIMATAIVALFGLTACDKFNEQFKDAPMSDTRNDGAMDLVDGADGFSNLGTKCDHGNRVYVAYHGDKAFAAIAVVPQDPTCGSAR